MIDSDDKCFRILSLDGGGIRGAFIAGFLAELEERLGCRLGDYFDLLAGTSTGAIIAAGLAFRIPAREIEAFYIKVGPEIFRRRPKKDLNCLQHVLSRVITHVGTPYGVDYDYLLQCKYNSEILSSALQGVFGTKILGESENRLVIPAFDLTRGQTIVFKTPHYPGLDRDRYYKVVDILRATTAAPTYFEHATIEPGSAYADGGIWANNPSMVALAELFKIPAEQGGAETIPASKVRLLSVGTGKASSFNQPPGSDAGLLWWGPRLFNTSSVAQSQGINFQALFILKDRLHRVDYDLPDGTWALDHVQTLSEMTRIGHERATENLVTLRSSFFHTRSQFPYAPYDPSPPAGL